jgi:hypothetical protein
MMARPTMARAVIVTMVSSQTRDREARLKNTHHLLWLEMDFPAQKVV